MYRLYVSNKKGFLYTIEKKEIVKSEKGDISGNFRSRKKSIDGKLRSVQDRLKTLTSNRKTSVNQSLNFSVILADKFLDLHDEKIQDLESDIRESEKEIEEMDKVLKRAIEF